MPGYRGHLSGAMIPIAIFYLFGVGAFYSWQVLSYMSLLTFLGALAPDIDTQSRGRSLFFVLLFGIALFAFFVRVWALFFGVFVLFYSVLQLVHRQRLHRFSFWAMIVFFISAVVIFIQPEWTVFVLLGAVSFLLGVVSHLLLDGCRLF